MLHIRVDGLPLCSSPYWGFEQMNEWDSLFPSERQPRCGAFARTAESRSTAELYRQAGRVAAMISLILPGRMVVICPGRCGDYRGLWVGPPREEDSP